jgi:hypothetical protein
VSEAFAGRRAMLRLEGLSSIERRLARLPAEKIGRTADMQYKKVASDSDHNSLFLVNTTDA